MTEERFSSCPMCGESVSSNLSTCDACGYPMPVEEQDEDDLDDD